MTYEQTLHYLYNKLPLFSRIGIKAYKADLKNTIALCKYLGDPQKKIKTIHVAGTNGKGSTSHMLAAVFQQCGYNTGLYTSPHLKDFRERIKVNGEMISQEFVVAFVEKMKMMSDEIEPSFFELTFVMALEYFVQQRVDIAIIETGLGGRLDSTNVVIPEVSVITNIGFDHMDILGDTIEKIAVEKAGIIKKDVPVIIGEATAETRVIFKRKAGDLNSPIFFAEEEYKIVAVKTWDEKLQVKIVDIDSSNNNYTLDLAGLYQVKNLLTVLSTIDLLKSNFSLSEKNIQDALGNVKNLTGLHGRWEVTRSRPTVVLDVAHNVDGIQQLINQINTRSFEKLHIVFGMVKDKEIEEVLAKLPKNAIYYFTKAQIQRALPEDKLFERATKFNLMGSSYDEVNKALKSALEKASEEDLILVCGSVFVVGEVDLKIIQNVYN